MLTGYSNMCIIQKKIQMRERERGVYFLTGAGALCSKRVGLVTMAVVNSKGDENGKGS